MRERARSHALFLAMLCCVLWHASVGAATPLHLTTAQMLTVPGQGYAPPPYSIDQATLRGTWQSVTLPHTLTRDLIAFAQSHKGAGPASVITWYRIQLPPLPAANSPRYLYIPRWKTDGQLAVYGDQRLLYQSHASLQWNSWNIPLWIALDQSADAVAPRSILLRIERPLNSGGGISSVWLGENDHLSWRYHVRDLLQVQLPYTSSAAFLAVGLFSFLIWCRLYSEMEYLLFFYIAVASFLRTLHYHVGDNPLPISDAWFSWLTINSLCWMMLIMHLFLNYLHHRQLRWLNHVIGGLTLAIGIATLPGLSSQLNAYGLAPLIYVLLICMGSVIGGFGLYQSRRVGSRDGLLLGAWAIVGMLLGGYDWLLQNNYLDIESIYLGPYSNIGAFLIFIYIIFHRYLAANENVRQLNASLQSRLQQREDELQQSYLHLREVEHRQMISVERQRLIQDMHDGMGSSLVMALLAVEKGRIDYTMLAEVLRSCIDDLKLTIDSMEPAQADLLLLLATLRFRLGPRLESAGIRLFWEIGNVPQLDWINPSNALHILRILQEAFTNIIKHTQATEIHVVTAVEALHVVVSVIDNGQGFAVQQGVDNPGKGLGNQIRRATAINAQIHWQSSAAGTCLSLRLPIRLANIG
jgi:signal transduction histidine kinase